VGRGGQLNGYPNAMAFFTCKRQSGGGKGDRLGKVDEATMRPDFCQEGGCEFSK